MRKLAFLFLAVFVSFAVFTAGRSQQPAPTRQPASDNQQQFADLGVCNLENGQQISGCKLGYRTFGKLNADRSNAVLFPSYFSGTSADLAGFIAANELFDPSKYFVIAVDAFGDGVSSSPSNSVSQPGPLFPAFTFPLSARRASLVTICFSGTRKKTRCVPIPPGRTAIMLSARLSVRSRHCTTCT
jgi:hypothetical protein